MVDAQRSREKRRRNRCTGVHGMGRFGRVDITSKRHRHTILDHILNEDAVRFAHEIKQAVGQRMP